jgi:hypothetical protein
MHVEVVHVAAVVAAVVAAADLTLYNGWLVENTCRDVL